MQKKTFLLFLSFLLLGSGIAHAQKLTKTLTENQLASPKGHLFTTLNKNQVRAIRKAAAQKTGLEFEIEIKGKTYHAILQPVEIRSSSFRAEKTRLQSGSLQRKSVETLPSSHFRGQVEDVSAANGSASSITLSLSQRGGKEYLNGLVVNPEEDVVYGFESGPIQAGKPLALRVSRADLKLLADKSCGVTPEFIERNEMFLPAPPETQGANPPIEMGGSILVTEIAIEVDFEFVSQNGGVQGAQDKIESILNGMNAIYESQTGITFVLSFIHFWEDNSDPYISTDPLTLLNIFRDYWYANFSEVERDTAHLWSGLDLDASWVGIAFLSVICSRSNGYGLSSDFTSDVAILVTLMSHGVGHNFGAHDDASCDPHYIMCQNMSGAMQQFSPHSITEITEFAAMLSCLEAPVSCPEDLDGDGNVLGPDLAALLFAWGPNPGHPADFNGDGNVLGDDLATLLFAWGPCD